MLNVRHKTATAMILTALEEIQVGDGVEVMDISDAPVLPPISPSFTNAPQPEAASTNTVPPKINCSASPTSLRAGESASISCEAVSPDNRPVNITYVANGGKLSSNRNQATLDTTDSARDQSRSALRLLMTGIERIDRGTSTWKPPRLPCLQHKS